MKILKLLFCLTSFSSFVLGMLEPVNDVQAELIAAVRSNDVGKIDAALKKGARIDKPYGSQEETALHVAMATGKLQTLEKLWQTTEKEKVDLNVQDAQGKTPLHRALEGANSKILRFIFEDEEKKKLIQPNLEDKNGNTILHAALINQFSHSFAPKILELEGTEINMLNKADVTPLHEALKHNNEAVALLLLNKTDIKVNSKDKDGNTPLHFAVSPGVQIEAVKLLTAKDRTLVNEKNNAGLTPLHLLIETMNSDETFGHAGMIKKNEQAIKLFFNVGADAKITTKDGKTALELAETPHTKEVIRGLIARSTKLVE